MELEERFKDFFVGNYDALYRQAYGLVKEKSRITGEGVSGITLADSCWEIEIEGPFLIFYHVNRQKYCELIAFKRK